MSFHVHKLRPVPTGGREPEAQVNHLSVLIELLIQAPRSQLRHCGSKEMETAAREVTLSAHRGAGHWSGGRPA